jgi:hypothetical protein
MKKKINWNALSKKPYRDWPDRALIVQAKSQHHGIFTEDCFSTHDLMEYDAILAELARRGFEQATELEFVKSGKS